jgi:hypothetical protein
MAMPKKRMGWRSWLVVAFGVALLGLVLLVVRQELRPVDVRAISNDWEDSAHADLAAEAFVHWDNADPVAVPKDCAKCHSTYGFGDYLGEDGSPAGVVDANAKVGSVIFCTTCHNEAAYRMTSVSFPSGVTIEHLGREAVCMQCHQGRQSGASVSKATAGKDEDAVDSKQSFINVHYRIAGATLMGSDAGAAYQYEARSYVGRFKHTKGLDTCIGCHDPHDLQIDPTKCSPCHSNVVTEEDLVRIRDVKDSTDYDGDADAQEPIFSEIATLQDRLYGAIQSYAVQIAGNPLAYNSTASPYFFIDTDNDGLASAEESKSVNKYSAFTPRLLKAAYNYQFVAKDPGNGAHNGKYILQILYDSLQDLGKRVPVNMQSLVRP